MMHFSKLWMVIFLMTLLKRGDFLEDTERNPTHLMVKPLDLKKVLIKWQPPHDVSQVNHYKVSIEGKNRKKPLHLVEEVNVTSPSRLLVRNKLKPKQSYRISVSAMTRDRTTLGNQTIGYRHRLMPLGVSIKAEVIAPTEARVTVTYVRPVKVEYLKVLYSEESSVKWTLLRHFRGLVGEFQQVFIPGLTPGKKYFFMAKAKISGKIRHTITHLEMPDMTAAGAPASLTKPRPPRHLEEGTTTPSTTTTSTTPSTTTPATTTTSTKTTTGAPTTTKFADLGQQEFKKKWKKIQPTDPITLSLDVIKRGKTTTVHWNVLTGDVFNIDHFTLAVTDREGDTPVNRTVIKKQRFRALYSKYSKPGNTVTVQAYDQHSQLLGAENFTISQDSPHSHLFEINEVHADDVIVNWLFSSQPEKSAGFTIKDRKTKTARQYLYSRKKSGTLKITHLYEDSVYDVMFTGPDSGQTKHVTLVTPPHGHYGQSVKVNW